MFNPDDTMTEIDLEPFFNEGGADFDVETDLAVDGWNKGIGTRFVDFIKSKLS